MCNSECIHGECGALSPNELKEPKSVFRRTLQSHQTDVYMKAGDSPVSGAAVIAF